MENLLKELVQVGDYMIRYDLAWGNSGNISARVDDDSYLVTASGTFLGELSDNDFVKVGLNGNLIETNRKPTKETPMHEAIYEARPEIKAVLHSSPLYSMMLASSKYEIPSNLFIESMYYLDRVERVKYCVPGSKELGEAVREKANKANILILENHGVLVYDTSLQEARMALHTLELACKMFVLSLQSEFEFNEIPKNSVKAFLQSGAYKPKREWIE